MLAYALRPATEADTDELFRIHRASMTDYVVEALGEWPENFARQQHGAWLGEGRAQAVIADGQIVGSIDVAWTVDALHVVRMEMDPDFQSRGIGRAILSDLLVEARQRGLPARLEVFAHNPARRLYERLGFRETGRDGPSVEMEWQPPDDAGHPPVR